jgi:DNA helicase-2/ATP-dependent DNA helicase PcrA
VDDPDGFQVMTIHKAKGNQFDGAIVLRRQRRDGKQIASNSSGVMMLLHIEEAERS